MRDEYCRVKYNALQECLPALHPASILPALKTSEWLEKNNLIISPEFETETGWWDHAMTTNHSPT